MPTYRELMVLAAVFVPFIIILLVLIIPVIFRACWNKFRCCRRGCHKCCRKKDRDMQEDWVTAHENKLSSTTKSFGDDKHDGLYIRLLEPSIPAQVFIYLLIGVIFVAINGLTDVPFYVMFIIFFIVWTCLYLDFVKRFYVKRVADGDVQLGAKTIYARTSMSYFNYMAIKKQESRGGSKEKFDAYEAAGISRENAVRKVKRYFGACKEAWTAYRIQVIVGLISILVITLISTIFSNCMCIATSPTEISTWLSRRIGNQYCNTGEICNVYFTLADTEGDMIVNFHVSESPDLAYTAYDVVSHARGDASVEEWVNSYAFRADATTYKMNTVRELHRWINWADVTNLTAGTTYYFLAVYTIGGKIITSSKEYKIRTLPADGTYTFITGGDMSVDGDGEKLVKHAASKQPHFAIIGGDNAYDNAFKACYMRWDKWFYRWDRYMTQNEGGYTIPVLLAIGNHETGGFGMEPGDDPYYTPYFPQQLNLGNVDPRFRLSYHAHRLGNASYFILDTDAVARMDGPQKQWIDSELSAPNKLKIVIYHGNIYPSADLDREMARTGREHWVPLFDRHNVSIVFENHLHLYKRTKPLRNNKVDPEGITYFGDGTWGVMSNIVSLSNEFYIERVNRNKHFFHVTMQNYSYMSVSAIERTGRVFDFWEKYYN